MSTPISMPSNIGFKSSRFSLSRKTSISQSPFTGAQQVYAHSQALWTASYTLPPMKREKASEWLSFFMKLKGREGTFLAYDPDAKAPLGKITGAVTLDGAISIGDSSIDVSTTNNSKVDAFKAGDYIQIGSGADSRLYMITDDADTDSSGDTTLNIQPSIKKSATSGSSVIYNDPKCVFRLDIDDIGWDTNHCSVYGLTFSCTEAN